MKDFKIPVYKWDDFKKQVEKLNRKAVKIGCPEITLIETGRDVLTFFEQLPDGSSIEKVLNVVCGSIDGKAPFINGYSFVASLDHREGGNIIRRFDMDNPVPADWLTRLCLCDHCKINRVRNSTFLLKDEIGAIIQVGSSCLKDFMGFNHNPEFLAQIAEFLETAGGNIGGGDSSSHGAHCLPSLLDILSLSSAVIRKSGFYRSKAKSDENGLPSTGGLVWEQVNYRGLKGEDYRKIEDKVITPNGQDRETALNVISWGASINPTGEYEQNIKTLLKGQAVESRYMGLVVSSVWAYMKANNLTPDFVKIEKPSITSEFLGGIKDKLVNVKAKLVYVRFIEGDYGKSALLKFKDEKGNSLSWFSTSFGFGFNEGAQDVDGLIVKATVKAHNEFKGVKETVITRAQFVEGVKA